MTNRSKELYSKFCDLFPQFSREEQTVKDIPGGGGIIVNPVVGLRGPKFIFIYHNAGDWELHFK